MKTVDLRTAVEWVEAEIAKRGSDYVYTRELLFRKYGKCVNVLFDYDEEEEKQINFRPGCIVGSVAVANLVSMEAIMEAGRNYSDVNDLADWLFFMKNTSFTSGAQIYLMAAQKTQDQGGTWGEAHWKGLAHLLHQRIYMGGGSDLEFLFEIFGQPRPESEWREHNFQKLSELGEEMNAS